jgi:hypothetical protein
MTMMTNQSEKQVKLLENDRIKINVELEREKEQLINQLKNLKKEDLLPKKPEKQSVWKKILKVLMG